MVHFHMKQHPVQYGKEVMAEHNKIGEIGEDLAEKWLISRGFDIVERNYREKWGEIDIIAKKDKQIRFVEVKAVSYETKKDLEDAVIRGTWRPEENVHRSKLTKLSRAIETWMEKYKYRGDFQIDVVTVRIVTREKYAKIKMIENVILE